LGEDYYENIDPQLSKGKTNSRISNTVDRIETIKRYVTLDNLCDIGCGEGIFLETLRDMGYKNLIGIEPGSIAQEYAKKHSLDIRQVTIGDCGHILEQNCINTVTMFHVVEHLTEPIRALEVVFKYMKTGARLVIETPDMSSYLLKKVQYEHEPVYSEHVYLFDSNNIEMILKKVGFKIIKKGKRDFDPKNLTIRGSLERLGVVKPKKFQKTACVFPASIVTTGPKYSGGAVSRTCFFSHF
jgi:2-polyprenyl-3-methyl-5-hydroxy-6-metoxy-1,4-benzoquinol methylase